MPEVLTLTVKPRVLVNKRAALGDQLNDVFQLPASYALDHVSVKLVEVPLIGGGAVFVIEEGTLVGGVFTGAGIFYSLYTALGTIPERQYTIDSKTADAGYINVGIGPNNKGKAIQVTYLGIGSIVSAEDINELAQGALTTTDFIFNGSVHVPGTLSVAGDLEIQGAINKTVTEVDELKVKDSRIILNSDGGPITTAGIEVAGTWSVVPSLIWNGDDEEWHLTGSLIMLGDFKAPVGGVVATAANVGKIFYDVSTGQYMGVAADPGGINNPRLVVIG